MLYMPFACPKLSWSSSSGRSPKTSMGHSRCGLGYETIEQQMLAAAIVLPVVDEADVAGCPSELVRFLAKNEDRSLLTGFYGNARCLIRYIHILDGKLRLYRGRPGP